MSKKAKRLIKEEKEKKTKKLDLSDCELKTFPEEIFEFTWLEELSLKSSLGYIKTLPDKFKDLKNLKSLDLRYNNISDISFLKNLIKLQTLDLNGNNFSDISSLENLTNLRALFLIENNISDYSFLKSLTNLQALFLSLNDISDISFLKNLTNLQALDLSENNISDISFLENLTKLQILKLSNNNISDIMPLLPMLKSGRTIGEESYPCDISIGNNPLTNPPMSIVKQGSKAVINWFEQMKKGKKPLFEAKLMILGQPDAGKTAFTKLQFNPEYKVKPGKTSSTLGIAIHKNKEFVHQNRKNQNIKAHLWDFGGQDIQKMLHQFFITENCLYILVSDKRAENTNFNYWFQMINLLGPKSSVIVLENPIDIKSANKDFPFNQYKELFKGLNINKPIEVDLSKTRGKYKTEWQLLNETIEKKLSKLEIVNRSVPKTWSLIRDELEKKKQEKYISKDEFHKICSKPEIGLTHEQSDLCLSYLRELGDLAYFDDRDLVTYIFLDHNWLTKGLYYILSDKDIQKNNGSFTREQAYKRWDTYKYSEDEKAMLIRLLLKDNFEICYELPEKKDVYITPLLLPEDKPKEWEYKTNLHFRYQYGFIPHGIISRLIVQVHEKIDGENIWATGVRLIDKANDVRAEIQQITDPDDNQKTIDIKINGEKQESKKLLRFIRTAVEKLHEKFQNISFKEMIGCNCETCTSLMQKGEKPSFYDYKKLKQKMRSSKFTEECEKSNYEEINIGQILNDTIIEKVG